MIQLKWFAVISVLFCSLTFAACPDFGNQLYFCTGHPADSWYLKFEQTTNQDGTLTFIINDLLDSAVHSSSIQFDLRRIQKERIACNEFALSFGIDDVQYMYLFDPIRKEISSAVLGIWSGKYTRRAECRIVDYIHGMSSNPHPQFLDEVQDNQANHSHMRIDSEEPNLHVDDTDHLINERLSSFYNIGMLPQNPSSPSDENQMIVADPTEDGSFIGQFGKSPKSPFND